MTDGGFQLSKDPENEIGAAAMVPVRSPLATIARFAAILFLTAFIAGLVYMSPSFP